jgi:hypothetical protein
VARGGQDVPTIGKVPVVPDVVVGEFTPRFSIFCGFKRALARRCMRSGANDVPERAWFASNR